MLAGPSDNCTTPMLGEAVRFVRKVNTLSSVRMTGMLCSVPGYPAANTRRRQYLDPMTDLIHLASSGGGRATILPSKGFNCIGLSFEIDGVRRSVLHAEPDILDDGSPTRSGMPVLFPFPNRIADARFDWRGEEYELPVAHPGDRNASHGFACRVPWFHFDVSDDGTSATGRFRLGRDVPKELPHWPGDLELRLTYTVGDRWLDVTSEVTNVDTHDVPFGLGFHPYFAPLPVSSAGGDIPDLGGQDAAIDDARVWCPADRYWVLEDSIPVGFTEPVAGTSALEDDPVLGERVLDDVLTGLPHEPLDDPEGLRPVASLSKDGARMELWCDLNWREIVVFTPDNRQSVAIEPYTCPTNAVKLAEQGLDVGWLTLHPRESWTARFRIQVGADG